MPNATNASLRELALSKRMTETERHDPARRRLREIKYLMRSMAPGGRLTRVQRYAMARATLLTWKAEVALADPVSNLDDCVRIDRLAEQARRKWQHLAEIHKAESKRTPSLQDLIHGQEAVSR